MKIAVVISICLLSSPVFSQHTVKQDTVKRESRIQPAADDNKVKFSAITPPLQPIPGAPAPFYTFYWEFGDGAYSKEASPEHVYKKTGDHTVQLWTTNNYDNGKPPPSRPQKVPVKKITFNDTHPVRPVLPDGFLTAKGVRDGVVDLPGAGQFLDARAVDVALSRGLAAVVARQPRRPG